MSEYQFLAVDRPLDDSQQAEVRTLSTRAKITATSFVYEYHWSNFRGTPNRMMERYYDAHLYLAAGHWDQLNDHGHLLATLTQLMPNCETGSKGARSRSETK